MEDKPQKLVFQELDHLQEIATEDQAATEGGRSLYWNPQPRPEYPKFPKYPDFPKQPYPAPWPTPTPPKGHPDPIYPVPCTNYPTKDGHLPWCAVIL